MTRFFSEYEILWLKRILIVLIVLIGLVLPVLLIWATADRIVPSFIPHSIAAKIDKTCELLRKGPDEPFDSLKWKRSGAKTIQETWHHRWQMCKSVQLLLPKMTEGSVISLLGEPEGISGNNQAPTGPDSRTDKFFQYAMPEGSLRVQIHEGEVVEALYSRLTRE
jgi:hypothetical protein